MLVKTMRLWQLNFALSVWRFYRKQLSLKMLKLKVIFQTNKSYEYGIYQRHFKDIHGRFPLQKFCINLKWYFIKECQKKFLLQEIELHYKQLSWRLLIVKSQRLRAASHQPAFMGNGLVVNTSEFQSSNPGSFSSNFQVISLSLVLKVQGYIHF